jgi:hypothetical protein
MSLKNIPNSELLFWPGYFSIRASLVCTFKKWEIFGIESSSTIMGL